MRPRTFTLLEVFAVMVIIAIMLLAVIPALDNAVPSYRLKGAARQLASTAELAQSEAVTRREEWMVVYDLDKRSYWIVFPKREAEQEQTAGTSAEEAEAAADAGDPAKAKAKGARPEDDVEHGKPPAEEETDAEKVEETNASRAPADLADRDSLAPTTLPDGVEFAGVVVGKEQKSSGTVYVRFTHRGNDGAHTVGLRLAAGEPGQPREEMWVKFNPLTRTIEYSEKKPTVRTLSGGSSTR